MKKQNKGKDMTRVKHGDAVKVHYTGKLEDGSVFDSSEGRDPLEFKIGGGQVIKGFEDGVTGMAIEEEKTVTMPPKEAYGELREDMIVKVPKTNFPKDITPEIGMKLQMQQENGAPVVVTVKEVAEEEVTLDANHHLAGKTLIFDLKLVSIN
jgi:FKBP-type peptidyl-prolyl cis-trans isomerase 2